MESQAPGSAQEVENAAGEKLAYVTLLTSDSFAAGADVMLYSLKQTGTTADIVVLVTPQVSKAERLRLAKRGASVIECKPIANPNQKVHVQGWVNSGYTKLNIWNLTDYKCIVYLDADVLVLENIDELFDKGLVSGEFSASPDVYPPDKFNAGVLVVCPCEATFMDMMDKIGVLPSHDGGDTGFLNAYFPDWFSKSAAHCKLPFGYNAQRLVHWMTFDKQPGYWNSIKPLKVIHYSSSPKPWEETKKKGPLEMLWFEYMMKSTGMGAMGSMFSMGF